MPSYFDVPSFGGNSRLVGFLILGIRFLNLFVLDGRLGLVLLLFHNLFMDLLFIKVN